MYAFEDPLYTIYNIFFRNLLMYMIYIHIFYVSNRFMYKKNIGTLKVLVRLYTLEISKHYHIFARIGTSVRIFFLSKKRVFFWIAFPLGKSTIKDHTFFILLMRKIELQINFSSQKEGRGISVQSWFKKKSGLSWPNE